MAIPLRKTVLWAIGVGAIAAAVYFSFQTQPVPVDLAKVTRGPMEVTINGDGVTRIQNLYEVSSPVTGTVHRSPVTVGDKVIAGETLVAVIEPTQPAFLDTRSRLQAEAAVQEAGAALRVAEAAIGRAEADYKYTREQFERAETLFGGGTITQSNLDESKLLQERARTALVLALSERALRQSTLDRTNAALVGPDASASNADEQCCIQIFAPADGEILFIASTSEHVVTVGAPLVSIGEPDDLELVVDLLSSDVVRLNEGAIAYVERWGGDAILVAKIRRMEPSAFTKISALGIAEQRVRVLLDILSSTDERPMLGDGFRVFVRVIEWQKDDTLQVPISALFRVGEDWTVFRVIEGQAVATKVDIGQRNASVAQILGGVFEDEVVITHPSDRVGDRVEIVDRNEL